MGEVQSRFFQPSDNAPLKVGCQGSSVTPNDSLIPARELGKCFRFLRSLLILARQKNSWSPPVIAGVFWRFLISIVNIGTYREILSLLKLRPFAEVVQNNPGFAFKYLAPNYLARGFRGTECAACFLHHYRRIHAALPEGVLRQILQGSITLHEIAEGGNRFALTLGLAGPIGDKEGELSLDLRVDGKKVLNLAFTIVPGWVVKSEAAEILLISRLQGTWGCRPQVRLVRKAFHEFHPPKLLLAALQGIAGAFGIVEVEAVCATNQKFYRKQYADLFKNRYDDFFAKVGMVKTAAGFYISPIPIEGRLLASIRRNRSRARKRRAIRRQIQLDCAAFFLGAADRTADTVNSTPVPGAVESRLSPISSSTAENNVSL